jgi:low affinity Fe/Cu permease
VNGVTERTSPSLLLRRFALVADRVAHVTGHPLTFMFFCAGIVLWAAASIVLHLSSGWQSVINTVITITTFLMVFLIQSTQSRDAAAVQAKLDELIRALEPANNQFIGIETRTLKEVHELRQETTDEVKKLEELVLEVASNRPTPAANDSDKQAASPERRE